MKTLVIEPDSQADYQLFVGLAKRLHVKYREEQIMENTPVNDMNESEFFSLFGSLEGVDSEILIDNITSARTTQDSDISWTK